MQSSFDPDVWRGREDPEDAGGGDPLAGQRWHHRVIAPGTADFAGAPVLLGFACDEGVRRNAGRPGAKAGPNAIRAALANLALHRDEAIFDSGNVTCEGEDLERAQTELAARIGEILDRGGRPIVLGGGHEVAYGSFLGQQAHLGAHPASCGNLAIINFDAHFDLRDPRLGASSGTPFRQAHDWCSANAKAFNYLVIGVNRSANTASLFDFARASRCVWLEDIDLQEAASAQDLLNRHVDAFVARAGAIHLSLCLDVFNAAFAPGVSAPAALGLAPATVLRGIETIKQACARQGVPIALFEVAELNPLFDRDHTTARLAARCIDEFLWR